jgi:DNA repair exonuclease SbcCD ATPase subunit
MVDFNCFQMMMVTRNAELEIEQTSGGGNEYAGNSEEDDEEAQLRMAIELSMAEAGAGDAGSVDAATGGRGRGGRGARGGRGRAGARHPLDIYQVSLHPSTSLVALLRYSSHSGRGRGSRGGRAAAQVEADGNEEDDYELRSALAISDEIEQREAELRKQQEMLEKAQLEQAMALSMADSATRQVEEEKARQSGREKARTRQRQIEVREQQQRAREREQEWVREKASLRAEAAARQREAAQMKQEREALGTKTYSTPRLATHLSSTRAIVCDFRLY